MLAANEPSALANRAVCALYLGCARACIDDCAAALKALEVEKATPGATTTFVHLNAYKEEEIGRAHV